MSHLASVSALALAVTISGAALAQQQTNPAGTGQGSGVVTPGTTAPVAPSVPYYPGGVQPPNAGQVLGGGNANGVSSSRPITGSEEDNFDLTPKAGAGGTIHGSDTGPVWTGSRPISVGQANSDVHQVRKGDTLWGICDQYFQNPYQWPRIWSYNPQIQNPHWIYPGDQVRLKSDAVVSTTTSPAPAQGGSLVDRRRQVPQDTVFLRDTGFIEDDDSSNWAISPARAKTRCS